MKPKSVHYSKIPAAVKESGCVALGGYAVFTGLFCSIPICEFLHKRDTKKGKGLPAVGYVLLTGKGKTKKIYYCRYGFVNDNDIYE